MLEIILDKKIVFMLLGGITVIGVLSKLVVNVVLKRLVHAAGNMNKSNHPLMRLVRAKFEHACMVSDKVGNVGVFVDKYLYEYKVIGMKLHTWRRMEKAAAGMCLLVGAGGAAAEYTLRGMQEAVIRTGATGAILAILVYLFHLTTDEGYRLDAVKNYMVDYLENVCLHKYEKPAPKELKVMAPEVPIPDFGPVSDKAIQEEEDKKAAELLKEVPPERQKVNQQDKQDVRQPEVARVQQAESQKEIKEDKPQKPLQEVPIPDVEPEVVIPPVKQEETAAVKLREQIQAITEDKKEKKEEKLKEDIKKDVMIRQILEEFMA